MGSRIALRRYALSLSGSFSPDGLRILQHVADVFDGGGRFVHEPDDVVVQRVRAPPPSPPGPLLGCRRRRRHVLHADSAPQAPYPLHAGSDLRVGTALQAAEVPLRPGARTPGERHRPVADAGEDLVPEPPLQVQEVSEGQGQGV